MKLILTFFNTIAHQNGTVRFNTCFHFAKLCLKCAKNIHRFLSTQIFRLGIWVWVQDHRVHHKYQDTHADPHNAGRGLFFSHFGWLMVQERPEVDEKRRTIDMSDCIADPFVMIQKK